MPSHASRLALLALALAAVPAAALVAPTLAPAAPASPASPASPGEMPPLYAPNGMGAFPAEGSLGTHGCAFPVRVADVLRGAFEAGSEACLETGVVVASATAREGAGKDAVRGDFTLRAPDGSEILARVSRHWWQHGTPAPGHVVVVEGTLARDAHGAWRVDPVKRWVALNQPGREVEAWHVAAGLVPEHEYVWVTRTTVFEVHRNNDGDGNVGDDHVETGTLCPAAHLTTETTPPYFGIVSPPPVGATIRLYGATRYDDGHGWWEIHPIRAWEVLDSSRALEGCPDRTGESGVPPPGILPDRIPPVAQPVRHPPARTAARYP